MNTKDILEKASKDLESLSGHMFDLLTISKPISSDAAVNLSKVISKLSPLLGNLIEFNTIEFLNDQTEYTHLGVWKRQDPDFPDAIFDGLVTPAPGFEIKAWFPLATEITARFKESQNHFLYDQTYVSLIAWLPDQLIFGKPRIIDVCVVSGLSVAQARDNHYHNPPDYIVLEPEDTSRRTRNLQQTNTNGYKWQGTSEEFAQAETLIDSWGEDKRYYQPTLEYQALLRELTSRFPYRLDTNFAKIDRIVHPGIERFKSKVMNTTFHGLTIYQWSRLLSKGTDRAIRERFAEQFSIHNEDADELLL